MVVVVILFKKNCPLVPGNIALITQIDVVGLITKNTYALSNSSNYLKNIFTDIAGQNAVLKPLQSIKNLYFPFLIIRG